ncbi:hypothetical protein LCGC14_1019370 [marine sediment metagenome]|uniref:Uncharacterized protein n=1 Tax=marine sediment metagenome TaxID=412755 RepID=A0A0F9NJJ9_9ZZZZ
MSPTDPIIQDLWRSQVTTILNRLLAHSTLLTAQINAAVRSLEQLRNEAESCKTTPEESLSNSTPSTHSPSTASKPAQT